MSAAALNVVDLLSGKAPALVGWLQVPLTPSRVAAIAAFETRHGVEIMPHLLDALDDIIFDTARSVHEAKTLSDRAVSSHAGGN